jgi:hypothetical protein
MQTIETNLLIITKMMLMKKSDDVQKQFKQYQIQLAIFIVLIGIILFALIELMFR